MQESLSELERKLLTCQLEVSRDIKDINKDLHKYGTRVQLLEKAHVIIEESLARAETARQEAKTEHKSFADYVAKELRDIKISSVSRAEDEKIFREKLLESIAEIASTTQNNSEYISKQEAEKKQEEYANQRIAEINKPRQELWHKVKLTAVGVVTTAIVSGAIAGILVVYDLYKKLNGE